MPLWAIDSARAPNIQGYQNGTLILGTTYIANQLSPGSHGKPRPGCVDSGAVVG